MIIAGKRFNAITLCQLPGPGFDPAVISPVEQLHRFSLIKSNITHFTRDFPTVKHLQILNMTRLMLENLSLTLFRNLTDLRTIDLSYNRLTFFDSTVVEWNHHLQHIYLRGNIFDCDLDKFSWTLDKNNGSFASKVVDLTEMECGNENYPQKPVIKVMRYLKTLEIECPVLPGGMCNCTLDKVVRSPKSKYHIPIITVDCSFRGIKNLFTSIPRNTTTLNLSGNKISDLSPLAIGQAYSSVFDIYLDDNLIRSVDVLEGANWIKNFRVLSLRDNDIKMLPTYAFDNAFEKNRYALEIYLGNNPWICDCHFTPGFKELLLKYRTLIRDINDIRCAEQENDQNSLKLIRDLSLNSICREPRTLLMSPVDSINLILFLLILFIIIKLMYDYWIYKATGKLPWIATKLP
ncbi:protein singed wings 2 isoform X2 [Cimex lectularius]|nr:protein singed wings 2 isoform X2 [Cimex lectularius]